MLRQILEKLDILQSDIIELKASNNRIEKRQEAILEQTAGLIEFQTETRSYFGEIVSNQEFISEILGRHEVFK